MATDARGSSTGGFVGGGQKVFLLTLMGCSMLAAVGFSLFLFGSASQFMASTTDRIVTAGIGFGMILLGAAGTYFALR